MTMRTVRWEAHDITLDDGAELDRLAPQADGATGSSAPPDANDWATGEISAALSSAWLGGRQLAFCALIPLLAPGTTHSPWGLRPTRVAVVVVDPADPKLLVVGEAATFDRVESLLIQYQRDARANDPSRTTSSSAAAAAGLAVRALTELGLRDPIWNIRFGRIASLSHTDAANPALQRGVIAALHSDVLAVQPYLRRTLLGRFSFWRAQDTKWVDWHHDKFKHLRSAYEYAVTADRVLTEALESLERSMSWHETLTQGIAVQRQGNAANQIGQSAAVIAVASLVAGGASAASSVGTWGAVALGGVTFVAAALAIGATSALDASQPWWARATRAGFLQAFVLGAVLALTMLVTQELGKRTASAPDAPPSPTRTPAASATSTPTPATNPPPTRRAPPAP